MSLLNGFRLFEADVLRTESDILLNGFLEELIFRELENEANVFAKAFDVLGSFFFDCAIDETINIELPVDMFTDFVSYNQKQYRGIFYTSLIFNALVKGILNIEKNDGSSWADSIRALIETSPDKYKGLSLEEPADAVDIATIMLSNNLYGSPYDLLFKSINELQN